MIIIDLKNLSLSILINVRLIVLDLKIKCFKISKVKQSNFLLQHHPQIQEVI